jgi:hypothetical protein
MSEEKRSIVDLREMGDRYGLELVDVVKDGKVIMRDHAWNKQALQRAVAEVKDRCAGADIVELRGHLPNWALSAMAYAVSPAVCFFKIGPGGIYELTSTPFPIDAAEPTCGMLFDVTEDGDKVFVHTYTSDPHGDAHGFDLTKFDQITMPPIPAGKHVFISGETVNPVAVSMVLTYAEISRSVSIRFHEEPNYYCSVTHDPSVEIGDATPVK